MTTVRGRQKTRYSGNGGGDQASIRAMCGILLHNASLLLQRSLCSIQCTLNLPLALRLCVCLSALTNPFRLLLLYLRKREVLGHAVKVLNSVSGRGDRNS